MTSDSQSKVLITSLPDRDGVVAEIYFGSSQFAELSHVGSSFFCEVYPAVDGKPWRLELGELEQALASAKAKLLARQTDDR